MNKNFLALVFNIALLTVAGVKASQVPQKVTEHVERHETVRNAAGETTIDNVVDTTRQLDAQGRVVESRVHHVEDATTHHAFPAESAQPSVIARAADTVKDAANSAVVGVKGAAHKAGDAVSRAAHKASDVVTGAAHKANDVVTGAAHKVGGAAKGAANTVTNAADKVNSTVKTSWNGLDKTKKWIAGGLVGAAVAGLLYKLYEKYLAEEQVEEEDVIEIIITPADQVVEKTDIIKRKTY